MWQRILGVVSIALVSVLIGPRAHSEDAAKAPPAVDPRLAADDDAYMNRQASALLAEVDKALAANPPQAPETAARRMTLYLLDAVLHDPYAPNRPAVQKFYQRRMEALAKDLEHTKVKQGARIWKLYNHGFIARAASVTLAFDLHRGTPGFRLSDAHGKRQVVRSPGFPIAEYLAQRIARQCDVLFVSHLHGDHADEVFAKAFLDQGKPVVAAPGVLARWPLRQKLTVLPRQADVLQTVPVQKGAVELKLVVYPGQQYQDGGPPNNVVLVLTPEKLSFAHNGDQINDPYPAYQEDYKWIDHVHERYRVDVLMTNSWTDDIYRFTRGFDPKLVLPGHQNELGHPLWDRVPFWGDSEYLKLSYPKLLASHYPVIAMAWGESYHYLSQPAAKPR
jgi:L-ascorbate metabolism protein UlaG (beta-lactamase superfamily)